MTFGSVCSGIEAASVAWHPLGWNTAWVADIDPFASALLAHHYPDTHNYGDFTQIGTDAPAIDVLVGGTPCQSFSVAGLRGGLDDDRGNLALEFCRLADRLRPRWIVWENVPGVLSSNGGRDFGSILGAMGELGYGTAYRVLDAQYFGVPQRRRRVFVIGYSGDWRRAAAVLFERHSLSGYPPPSRQAREDIAPTISARTKGGGGLGTDFDCDGGLITGALACNTGPRGHDAGNFQSNQGVDGGFVIPILEAGARTGKSTDDIRAGSGIGESGDPMFTLQSGKQHGVFASTGHTSHCLNAGGMGRIDYETETLVSVAGTLKSNSGGGGLGSDPSETFVPVVVGALGSQHTPNGHGQSGVNLQAAAAGHILPVACIPIDMRQASRGGTMTNNRADGSSGGAPGTGIGEEGDPSPTIANSHIPAIAFSCKDHGADAGELSSTLRAMEFDGSHANGGGQVAVAFQESQTGCREYSEAGTLRSNGPGHDPVGTRIRQGSAVRRLTPLECERLMGLPDGYTAIPYRGKPAADGPRYKALGNSMAVPCMSWIGKRIQLVESLAQGARTRDAAGKEER